MYVCMYVRMHVCINKQANKQINKQTNKSSKKSITGSSQIIITICVNLLRFALCFYILGNVTFCGPTSVTMLGLSVMM